MVNGKVVTEQASSVFKFQRFIDEATIQLWETKNF